MEMNHREWQKDQSTPTPENLENIEAIKIKKVKKLIYLFNRKVGKWPGHKDAVAWQKKLADQFINDLLQVFKSKL